MRKNGPITAKAVRRTGFTLIELLVVIAIMSILTVITVSQFGMAQKRSRDVARKADLNSLSKAISNYYADYGVLPVQDDIDFGGEFKDATGYIYMKVVPTENSLLTEYCYAVTGSLDKFALFSKLENMEDEEYNKYNDGGDYDPNILFDCSSGYNFVVFSLNAGYADFE